jgi:hypothetical protein
MITPLDAGALEVARSRMKGPGQGLTNPARCAEAVYRHVVRFGAPAIPGLNRPPAGTAWDFLFGPEDGPLHELAFAWSEADEGGGPSPAEEQEVREQVSEPNLLEALAGCVAAREIEADRLAAAYERLATLQIETLELRAARGLTVGALSLDGIGAHLRAAVETGQAPAPIERLFETLRRQVRLAQGGPVAAGHDAELDKVLARIQGLRAKTVDRGCTEEEAINAARKVAELLDRYGLELGEVDLKAQACEGFGVGTGRRRMSPIDAAIPSVGAFCDCRVWAEKTAAGEIRYVFFGLPADVAGARFLYERVARAFTDESEAFKRTKLYAGHDSGERRAATTSFQTGLADGIVRKLKGLREERETTMRRTTGRDLVPLKEGVIEDELGRLGLRFTYRSQRGRSVLRRAYAAGKVAAERFTVEERLAGGEA